MQLVGDKKDIEYLKKDLHTLTYTHAYFFKIISLNI